MKLLTAIFSCILFQYATAQTLGGNSVFNFLKLPNTTQLTALGGVNVSSTSNDVGLAFNNPALLRPEMHSQLNAVFNGFYNGVNAYHLSMAYRAKKVATNFLWGMTYFDYGTAIQTDASGNVLGDFRPTDWVMQLSASRQYLERWHYGMTLKFISSNYGPYRSNGIAADVGVLYRDTANLLSVSVLAKNMGTQLRKYNDAGPEDLPFDLQLGITKRLANAPLGFSLTAHHLHQFDIRYKDTAFNNSNGLSGESGTIDQLLRHFVFATDVYIGDRVQLTAGYNYLRRKELSIGNTGNGLTGFSLGVALLLNKLQIRYARSQYQQNTAYNQFGLSMPLNQYFGLGKWGQKINW